MTNTIYRYVYRITNTKEKKHYYGKHTTKIIPVKEIGIKYFSSSRCKEFMNDQKLNPQNYKYKIIKLCSSKEELVALESKLHNKFNVGRNPNFYNKVNQTINGFDSSGLVSVKDTNGNISQVSISDPKYLSGELVGVTKGQILVTDIIGNIFYVNYGDHRFLSGELKTLRVGYTVPGRVFSDVHKKNLSKSSKGISKSELHVEAMRKRVSNCIWIHSKIENKEYHIQKNLPIPDGYKLGRLIGSVTGLKWIWNPVTLERSMIQKLEIPPKDWVDGRGPRSKKI